MGFKFLIFGECDIEEWDTIIAKSREIDQDREKHPEKFAKRLFPSHMIVGELPKLTKDIKFFVITEADNPQTLVDSLAQWMTVGFSYQSVRIVESSKVAEAFEQLT